MSELAHEIKYFWADKTGSTIYLATLLWVETVDTAVLALARPGLTLCFPGGCLIELKANDGYEYDLEADRLTVTEYADISDFRPPTADIDGAILATQREVDYYAKHWPRYQATIIPTPTPPASDRG